MKYTAILFLLLSISLHGQGTISDQHEKEILQIKKQITANKDKLIILVNANGEAELQRVINQNFPENIETTYNILKNKQGQIIYVGEFPESLSGDWVLELKHYFSSNGKLIGFEKTLTYFNEDCTDGAAIENSIELYDNNFKVIKTVKTLTDSEGKKLEEKDCGHAYNWDIDKRATVKELIQLKKIKE